MKFRQCILYFWSCILCFSFLATTIPAQNVFSISDGDTGYYVQWFGIKEGIYFNGISWKPDGSYALVVGSEGSVYKTDGKHFTALNTGLDIRTSLWDVAWKPDGSYAIIVGNDYILKFDGEKFQILKEDFYGGCTGVYWKPDGSYAIISKIKGWGEASLIFDGSSFREIEDFDIEYFDYLSWKPDGSYALITSWDGNLWKFDGTDLVLIKKGIHGGSGWKPDGSIALAVDGRTVYSYNGFELAKKYEFAKVGDDYPDLYDIAWNPDGTKALIVGNIGPDCFGVAALFDGTNFFNIPVEPPCSFFRKIRWKPDGTMALIIGGSGGVGRFAPTLKVDLDVSSPGIYSADQLDINIYVSDNYGTPVEGASIGIESSVGGSFSPIVDEGDGRYKTVFIPPAVEKQTMANISVTAFHPELDFNRGIGFKTITVNPSPLLKVAANVVPSTLYSGGISTINILVTSFLVNGTQGISGVKITLKCDGGGIFSAVEDLGAGNYRATFTAPKVLGPAKLEITIQASKPKYVDGQLKIQITVIPFEPGKGNVHIFVKDSTNNPIAGALVKFVSQPAGQASLNAISDFNGYVGFDNILQGSYMISVSKVGYDSIEKTETVTPGETIIDTITLYPASPQPSPTPTPSPTPSPSPSPTPPITPSPTPLPSPREPSTYGLIAVGAGIAIAGIAIAIAIVKIKKR